MKRFNFVIQLKKNKLMVHATQCLAEMGCANRNCNVKRHMEDFLFQEINK